MESGLSRREFLERAKTGLKLLLLPSALTGLASLVFGDEDYLAKLPPLNGRKVTEELIQEMLNVGSVKGILEKYGNKDNIFYVQFTPDGRNNLDDLVRKAPENWDGSYLLACDDQDKRKEFDKNEGFFMLRLAITASFLSNKNKKLRFVFYNIAKDPNIIFKDNSYTSPRDHFFFKLFTYENSDLGFPLVILYDNMGRILDGSYGGPASIRGVCGRFNNDVIWTEHLFYGMHITENGLNIAIKYNFGRKIKKEVKGEKD